MKIGDLVKRVGSADPQEIADNNELGIGLLVDIERRVKVYPNSLTDPDYIVMWPKYGMGWEMSLRLEVVSESR